MILCFCFTEVFSQLPPTYSITAYDTASKGFYFLTPIKLGTASPGTPAHLILDSKGRVVYYKKFNSNTGDFKLHANGLMSYHNNSKFYLMDSTFTVIDSVRIKNGLLFDAHELLILPNGHYTLLGNEKVQMNLSSYNMFNQNNTPGSPNATVTCGVIQEQDAAKNVVFEWHSKDYYSFADVDEVFLNNPSNVDWTHYNAVEMDQDGNYLVSSRHFNEITKINRSDSSIVWRFGGKQNQFVFTNDPSKFLAQHDIRRLSNGNVTMFDNGYNTVPLHPASTKEYKLNETAKTATLVWSFTENAGAYSRFIGNTQRLSNGNTLTDWGGITNNVNALFNVVTPGGNKIFEIVFSDTLRSYRAFNFSPTWSFKQPTITCNYNGTQYYLDAGPGYSSYLWSTGATSQTIAISLPGDYYVFVPYGSGGKVSSEWYSVTSVTNPCVFALVEEAKESATKCKIYPNPFTDSFIIESQSGPFEIFDLMGRKLMTTSAFSEINLEVNMKDFQPGIYFVRMDGCVKRIVKQ
jgi:hypothetical protein